MTVVPVETIQVLSSEKTTCWASVTGWYASRNKIRPAASMGDSFRNWVRANDESRSGEHGPSDWSRLAAIYVTLLTSESPSVNPEKPQSVSPETQGLDSKQNASDPAHYGVAFSHRMCLRLYRTKEGFLGFGTESLENGDTVWIVPGS